jgi:hypothetical protein
MTWINLTKTLKRFSGPSGHQRKVKKRRGPMGEVVYVDFTQNRPDDIWELHQELNLSGETDYVLSIRCPDESYHELIARRIKQLDWEKVPYKIFLDGELVHHEIHYFT